MSRVLRPCGTPAAYQRHIYAGEDPDEACRAAYARYHREYRGGNDDVVEERRHRARAEGRAWRRLAKEYRCGTPSCSPRNWPGRADEPRLRG